MFVYIAVEFLYEHLLELLINLSFNLLTSTHKACVQVFDHQPVLCFLKDSQFRSCAVGCNQFSLLARRPPHINPSACPCRTCENGILFDLLRSPELGIEIYQGTGAFLDHGFRFLALCRRINPWLGIIAEGILCGRLLALRSLREAAYAVRDPLLQGDVDGARRAVSMIVGRDTDPLNAEGIAKAAVETVAENTSDGVTAPLFYMILFGGIGGVFYKAVNTMDSMIGYKNDRYRFFGTAAARLDDVMNYIPSRLSALLMILTCVVPFKGISNPQSPKGIFQSKSRGRLKEESPDTPQEKLPDSLQEKLPDMRAAFRIWRRDRRKSPSPNSAQTESVCAGALHQHLLGDTWYFGKLHHKAEIGDGDRTVEPHDITRAVSLMVRTSLLLYAIGTAVLLALVELSCWP